MTLSFTGPFVDGSQFITNYSQLAAGTKQTFDISSYINTSLGSVQTAFEDQGGECLEFTYTLDTDPNGTATLDGSVITYDP